MKQSLLIILAWGFVLTCAGGVSAVPVPYADSGLPANSRNAQRPSLSEEGKRFISEVAEQLRSENKWFVIRIDGHTDSIASEAYNEKLSLKRAISLGTYLVVHNGIDPSRVFVKGFGEREPMSSNATPEGRIANRRVEVLFLLPVEEP